MKPKLLRRITLALALAGSLAATTAAHAKSCQEITQPDAGACPLRLGNQVVFDRCFGSLPGDAKVQAFPNAACNSMRDTKKAADALAKQVNSYLGDAQRDLNQAKDRILKDAIDFEAIKDFNEAAEFPKQVSADINALVNDAQCGVNGTIKRVGNNLQAAQKLVADGFQIAQRLGAVLDSQRPSVAEANKIVAEIAAISNLAGAKTAEGQRAIQQLQTAINAIISNTQALVATDFNSVVADGTAVAGFVGPFITNCVACATTISGSISAMAAGGGTAAASPAACTTGAGCALAPIGGIAAAAGGAIGTVVSSQPCQAAANDSAKLKEHIDRIQKFVDSTAKLATSIPQNAERAIQASEALVKLAEQLGAEAEPRLVAIEAAIGRIVANAEAGGKILQTEVAPRVTRLAGNFLRDMSNEVNVLGTCFNKLIALSGKVGEDTFEGVAKMTAAVPNFVDAGKTVENAAQAFDDGKNAMDAFLRREHAKMAGDVRSLHIDVWGVAPGVFDPAKTVQHIGSLGGNISKVNKIAQDATALVAREARIIQEAVEAGKQGFLNGPKLQPAKAKYTTAKADVAAAKAAFRRAAIESAKAQARGKFTVAAAPAATATIPAINVQKLQPINLKAAIQKAPTKAVTLQPAVQKPVQGTVATPPKSVTPPKPATQLKPAIPPKPGTPTGK